MSTRKTIDTNNIVINGDIFIIPNKASTIKGIIEVYREKYFNKMNNICKLNGLEFDKENGYIIETWYLSKEIGCDNIPDHSIHTVTENGKRCTISVPSGRNLPEILFKDKKEGDVISIKLPVNIEIGDRHHVFDSEGISTEAIFNLKLNQLDYRYKRFGKFEDVLRSVCWM